MSEPVLKKYAKIAKFSQEAEDVFGAVIFKLKSLFSPTAIIKSVFPNMEEQLAKELIDNTAKIFEWSLTHTPDLCLLPSIDFQGSGRHAGVMARNCKKRTIKDELLLEMEVDFNRTIGIFRGSEGILLKETTPGYFVVKTCEKLRQRFLPGFNVSSGTEWLNSTEILETFHVAHPRIMKAMSVFGEKATEYAGSENNFPSVASSTKTSIPMKFTDSEMGNIELNFLIQVSCDMVPTIKLMFWPYDTMKWLQESKWPSPDVRHGLKEKHGCVLVPKQSTPGANDWRLSFAEIECQVMEMLFKNDNCYLTYFLLKCVYYRYIDSVECQCSAKKESPLGSYIIKTILLNMSSEHGPDSPVWSDPICALMELLNNLLCGLRQKSIPHFIIYKLNILHSVLNDHEDTCNLIIRAEEAVQFVIDNINICLEETENDLSFLFETIDTSDMMSTMEKLTYSTVTDHIQRMMLHFRSLKDYLSRMLSNPEGTSNAFMKKIAAFMFRSLNQSFGEIDLD